MGKLGKGKTTNPESTTYGSQQAAVLLHGEVAVGTHPFDRHDPSLLRLELQFDWKQWGRVSSVAS